MRGRCLRLFRVFDDHAKHSNVRKELIKIFFGQWILSKIKKKKKLKNCMLCCPHCSNEIKFN